MNYYIIEDIDNPIDKFFIVQTSMSYDQIECFIDEAKARSEENGSYVIEELEDLLTHCIGTLIIHDFSTMYI